VQTCLQSTCAPLLTVEQIGYCDRISESAVQYAERLLSTKPHLAERAAAVAKELVHEYKDHNFVIDLAEAKEHLGDGWIKTGTLELQAGEEIYSLVEMVNFFLGMAQSKRVFITGGVSMTTSIIVADAKSDSGAGAVRVLQLGAGSSLWPTRRSFCIPQFGQECIGLRRETFRAASRPRLVSSEGHGSKVSVDELLVKFLWRHLVTGNIV